MAWLESFTSWWYSVLALIIPVQPAPATPNEHWAVTMPWSEASGFRTFQAESTTIAAVCAAQPAAYLVFPAVIQGAHEVRVNGVPVLLWNTADFSRVSSFYGTPFLACQSIPAHATVQWTVVSFAQFFARFDQWPTLSDHQPLGNLFSRALHVFSAGAMVALALIVNLVMAGKVAGASARFLTGACLFVSFYLVIMESGAFGLPFKMQTLHQMADISLWLGVSCLFGFFGAEGLFKRALHRGFNLVIFLAVLIIASSSNGDQIQMGTTLPFIYAPVIFGNAIYRSVISCVKSGMARRDVIVLSQLVIFSVIAANDIGLILGLNSSVPLLPVGLFAVLFLAIISVERQISQTYVERDYLRQNLEAEVKIKTKSLEDALKRLQVAQAEVVQSAKLAGLGTLAAGIAHEINNSLNYVNGSLLPLSRLIERSSMETEPKQKAQRLLQVMGSGLQLTAKIISNLKSYAHAGGEREHVDVREVIEGILAILKSKLSVGIDVILDVEPGLQVFADRVALSQILMNLTDNAIDALVTLEGDRRLVFAGGQSGKDAVWLSLTDNGPGIPENILTNIYDPFFTTKPVGKGTGLGLYIVKNEISKCGGTIEIHSRTADVQGTQFVMTFPSAAIKDEAA